MPELTFAAEGEALFLPKALSQAGLAKSASDGRRMVEQGAVEVDGQRVTDIHFGLARGGRYLLKVGSKNRKFCYVTVT